MARNNSGAHGTTAADSSATHSAGIHLSLQGKGRCRKVAGREHPRPVLPKRRPRDPVHRHGPGQQDLLAVQRALKLEYSGL